MFRRDVLLYAEDDLGFADLFKHALAQAHLENKLIHVPDGEQAIAYIKGEGKYADREMYPLPSVLLLDLKMPRKNGFEVLQWLRQESRYPFLPVVVLTVSDEVRDLKMAYSLGANSFLFKPPSVNDLRNMIVTMQTYWMHINVNGDLGKQIQR